MTSKTFVLISLFYFFCCMSREEIRIMPADDLKDMIKAEYAFAQKAAETDIKTAFLYFLTKDAIVFNPQPVNAHRIYLSRESGGAQLKWYPARARISCSGDMGFSIGPWELVPVGEANPKFFGHYISVWQKFGNKWRVILDWGVSHARPGEKIDSLKVEQIQPIKFNISDSLIDNPAQEFSAIVLKKGWDAAISKYTTMSLHLYFEGELPIHDKKNALQKIEKLNLASEIEISGSDYAFNKDLGYMYGFAGGANEKQVFLILWIQTKHGQWEIFTLAFTPASKK